MDSKMEKLSPITSSYLKKDSVALNSLFNNNDNNNYSASGLSSGVKLDLDEIIKKSYCKKYVRNLC